MVKLHEKFVVDRAGKKKEVIIPYRDYENLLEDIHDLAVIAERRSEKTSSHKEMIKR